MSESHNRGWFWEARSQILLWYVGLMLGFIGLSIPLFSHLVLHQVDTRVREDLEEEMERFEIFFNQNINIYPDNSEEKPLKTIFKRFLSEAIPEDDTFLITIIDNQFYRSSPRGLPKVIQQDSELMKVSIVFFISLSQLIIREKNKVFSLPPISLLEKNKKLLLLLSLSAKFY